MHQRVSWEPMYVVPNITVDEPIEGGPISIVSPNDERLFHSLQQQPERSDFFGAFRNQFGRKVIPSVLIINTEQIPLPVDVALLAGFRDLLVASIIPLGWAFVNETGENSRRRMLYSDNLSFYPFVCLADTDDLRLVGSRTPASNEVDEISKFLGQTTPGIPSITLDGFSIDRFLYESLLYEWHERYVRKRSGFKLTKLFRSLNMANVAARMPGGREAQFYDYGRNIALWISAFEILAHPGGREKSGVRAVEKLFDQVDWPSNKLRFRQYAPHWPPHSKKKNGHGKIILAKALYHRLYNCRNAFLHGNPVKQGDLKVPGKGLPLHQAAPLLYRMALSGYLQMKSSHPLPGPHNTQPEIEALTRGWFWQRQIECGLLAVQNGPNE